MRSIAVLLNATIANLFILTAISINTNALAASAPHTPLTNPSTTPEAHLLTKRYHYPWIGSHPGKFPCEGLQDPQRPKIKRVRAPPITPPFQSLTHI